MSIPIRTCFVDMDGVLCHMEEAVRMRHPDMRDNETSYEYTLRMGEKHVWDAIAETNGEFWRTMPPLNPDTRGIWKRLRSLFRDVVILSKPMPNDAGCIPGKIAWLKEHLGDVMTTEPIFTANKHDYATPDSILIDDRDKIVNAFKSAGGNGILFTNSFEEIWPQLESLYLVCLCNTNMPVNDE